MDTELSAGTQIAGRFLVEKEVGRGGFGNVYRALDLTSTSTVALKVVVGKDVAPGEQGRLMREGEILASLAHPGIVRTIAYGILDQAWVGSFVAMEWLEGEDLAERQKRQPLSVGQAVELGADVAEALAAAHAAGVVHRDIKPGNVFLCRSDSVSPSPGFRPKIVDFGIAARENLKVTRLFDIQGTPAYMAPEQARGDAPVDYRSDIYSLGATLFELISGRPPHVGPTAIATLARLAAMPAPRLSEVRHGVPEQLDTLISRMLMTDPSARPSSSAEVASVLREIGAEVGRPSWVESVSSDPAPSLRLGASASRLLTSLVALGFDGPTSRQQALGLLRGHGAEAVPVGSDGLVAHFGARRALGSEAAAALDLGRRLGLMGAKVGVASGRSRLVDAGDGQTVRPIGEVVDRASALARDSRASSILVDVTTSELGRGLYELRSREGGATEVGEPLAARRAERLGGSPFVGREAELAQIVRCFERVRIDRNSLLVSLTGPPGIGKTRLRREVMARITSKADAPLLAVQRSEAYGAGRALGAAADLLRFLLGSGKGAEVAETQSAAVVRLGSETENLLSLSNRQLLGSLLANEPLPQDLDPRAYRDALWLAMTDLVTGIVSQQPLAIMMEDLQWADPESIAWLEHLLGRATRYPLLVMILVRPEFWERQEAWFKASDHVHLELRPLSRRASTQIAQALLGDVATSDVVDRIAQQAAGLPLFAEELARLTALGRDAAKAPTLQAAIQVSLDALDEESRDAAGRLSVFGLKGWDAGLSALGMSEPERLMKQLSNAEILVEQESSRFPGAGEWSFKHALFQEVAYVGLGENERKELHILAARWLASAGEEPATIARHFDLGDRPGEAAEFWTRAAEHALLTYALKDAVSMAERALAFAETPEEGTVRASILDEAWNRLDPRNAERETAIYALQQYAYDRKTRIRADGARARYDDARGTMDRAVEKLCEVRDQASELELHDEVARLTAALAARLAFAGRFAEADNEAKRLLRLANDNRVLAAAIDGWQTLAISRHTQGRPMAALDARRHAVSAAKDARLKEREATLTTNLGFALVTLGARQEARQTLEAGLALSEAIGSAGAVRHAKMNLLGWAATFGADHDLEGPLSSIRAEADAVAAGSFAPSDRSSLGILFYRGWELVRGQRDTRGHRARTLARMATEGYSRLMHNDLVAVAKAVWCTAELQAGAVQHAVQLAQDGAAMLDGGAPSLLNESTVYLALHDALLATSASTDARQAIARGLPALFRRLRGLLGSPYALSFITDLRDNVALLAAADGYGLLSVEDQALLDRVYG